jgi:hypothetical protein
MMQLKPDESALTDQDDFDIETKGPADNRNPGEVLCGRGSIFLHKPKNVPMNSASK